METLQQIKENYVTKRNEIKKIKARIEQREAQIQRLQKKRWRREEDNHWTQNVLRPIMDLVKTKFPNLVWNDFNYTPMGMRNAVSVFARHKDTPEESCIGSIVFTPNWLDGGVVHYDTKEKTHAPNNSISDLNGFNNKTAPLTDIQQLYDHVQKQLDDE
tara:strand:+ start:17119 stop:17595 length:477 start_codon:yes stop_codon:yes gene_type:complete